jgi:hypothetical protein
MFCSAMYVTGCHYRSGKNAPKWFSICIAMQHGTRVTRAMILQSGKQRHLA